jgi:hypothetical protein
MAKEYIERGEAKRVMKTNDWLNPAIPNVVNVILDRLPAADVVEVVRCRDCKHLVINPFGNGDICCRWDEWIYPEPNDFCSYGERKAGNEKGAVNGSKKVPGENQEN